MKKILLAGLCLIVSGHGLFAQNKTLGVGVATPNPNAALHVESPTGNQGFIMPRMTTAQRFASSFTSVLNASDKGLMVFDTDLNTIFIWNGSNWQNTGEVAGGVKLTFPYVDSVTSGTGTTDLIAFKYNAAEPKRILRVENHSTTNGSSALSVFNAGTGLAGYFQNANPATTSSTVWALTNSDAGGDLAPVAIYGESTGIGSLGGSFRTQNPANPHPALFAESKGTGSSIMAVTSTGFSAIMGEAMGGFSNGVSGISNAADPGSFAVLGQNNGGGPAGVFNISATANTSNAVEVSTAGVGSAGKFMVNNVNSAKPAVWAETNSTQPLSAAIYGLNTGTGDAAGVFRINNGASTFPAVIAETNGTGRAALFRKTGTTGSQPAVFVDSQGGHGIWADHNGATGYAAIIQTINTANANAGMLVESIGTGPSVWALKSTDAVSGDAFRAENLIASGAAASFATTNASNGQATLMSSTAGTGSAGHFFSSNTSSGGAALYTETAGTGAALQATTSSGFTAVYGRREGATNGNAGLFEITDAANTYPALQAQTTGTGSAINARHMGPTGDAIYAETTGAGGGSAGNFRISNPSNNASAVYAATNAPGGNAMSARNETNGIAFAIWQGGLQITTSDITTGTSLATRASAYRITSTAGTTFTIDFGPVNGEVFMIFNDTAQPITIPTSGINTTIPAGEGRTFVSFGGVIRGF